MNNLTKCMTNNVRLSGTTNQLNSTKYDGIAWTQEVCIKVRWAWIIFPWALVILSIMFLIVTMIENGKTKPWKNSASAMLYTRLDQDLQDSATASIRNNEGLIDGIEQRTVRLDTEDCTPRPVSASPKQIRFTLHIETIVY